jgi:predicted nucleic-acid-binding protein
MTGLDTNILLRYFVQDHPAQAKSAAWLIERDLTEQNPGYISLVAMVETVWTLLRAYELSKEEVVGIVERMLQSESLVVQNEPCGCSWRMGRLRFHADLRQEGISSR